MTSDEWAVFSHDPSAVSSPSRAQRLEEYVKAYESALQAVEAAKAMLESASQEIVRLFPEQEGEQSRETPSFVVTVSRTETHSWDKKKLEEMFGDGGKLPPYVKKSYGVDKKAWDRLPLIEQQIIIDALTRKLSPPKIKVTRKPAT